MSRQSTKAKFLAASLFSLSAIGTIALFSAVPMIAGMLSTTTTSPSEAQIFPQQPPIKLSRLPRSNQQQK